MLRSRDFKSRAFDVFAHFVVVGFLFTTLFAPHFHNHSHQKVEFDSQSLVATGFSARNHLTPENLHTNCAHVIDVDSDSSNQQSSEKHQQPLPHDDCIVCLHMMLEMDSNQSPSLLTGEEPVEMIPESERLIVALIPNYSAPLRGPPANS